MESGFKKDIIVQIQQCKIFMANRLSDSIHDFFYQDKISECGIFVSKKRPYLAASPDRLDVLNKMVIEIKCPYRSIFITACHLFKTIK